MFGNEGRNQQGFTLCRRSNFPLFICLCWHHIEFRKTTTRPISLISFSFPPFPSPLRTRRARNDAKMKEANWLGKLTVTAVPTRRALLPFLGSSWFPLIRTQFVGKASVLELCMFPTCVPNKAPFRLVLSRIKPDTNGWGQGVLSMGSFPRPVASPSASRGSFIPSSTFRRHARPETPTFWKQMVRCTSCLTVPPCLFLCPLGMLPIWILTSPQSRLLGQSLQPALVSVTQSKSPLLPGSLSRLLCYSVISPSSMSTFPVLAGLLAINGICRCFIFSTCVTLGYISRGL